MPNIQLAQGAPDDKLAGYVKTYFNKDLQQDIEQRLFLPQITQTEAYAGIADSGDEVLIARAPKVHVEPYVKDGDYSFDSSLEEPIRLVMKRGVQWSKFIDDRTLNRTHVAGLIASILSAATYATGEAQETEYFGEYPSYVPACNKGSAAGVKSKCYNLGTLQAPVTVTKNNVTDYLQQFTSVLNETGVKNESQNRAIVIPEIVAYYLNISPNLRSAAEIGGKSSLRTQFLIELPAIGKIFTSNLLPAANGVFPIICQTKEAMAYKAVAKDSKVVEPSSKHGKFARGYVMYDWSVVREEGLAVGYVQASAPSLS